MYYKIYRFDFIEERTVKGRICCVLPSFRSDGDELPAIRKIVRFREICQKLLIYKVLFEYVG